jgi:hypothetical protein|tara:strand:- start:361 stop:873 length:513 start_codon:yes stop_codon:yes gene_type:complete
MARKTGASRRQTLKVRERQQQAVELRKAGATTKQIANQLGYASPAGAYKAIMRELEATANAQSEGTEAVRQLEIQRLDQMLFPIWQQVISGDVQAITTALRIQERRANLLGLDAPKQIEARVRVDVISWNQAIRDFLDLYKELHGNSPEAPVLMDRLDKLGQERFAGIVT